MTEFDFNTTFRQRMLDESPLTLADFKEMYSWFMQTHQTRVADILAIRVVIQLDGSLRKFDEASSHLSRWLLRLTVVLVVLTGVITWFTIMLALHH